MPIALEPIQAHCRVSDPPVIKAVNVNRHMYDMKRSTAMVSLAKRRGGGISYHPLNEYEFCTGIAKHNLLRKATG